jgi:hypothetical protein
MKVFIIAGVGDHTNYIRHLTKSWPKRFGLEPVILRFGWRGDYKKNYKILKQKVVEFSKGKDCSIIGISAGASAALRLKSQLSEVICAVAICGRTSRGGFSVKSFSKYPAYWESVDALKDLQLKENVLIVRPYFDEIVAIDHMGVKSSKLLQVPYFLHIPSIMLILSRRASTIASFIRDEAKV